MKATNIRHRKSLTTEKIMTTDFNQQSELENPRYDFGYKQVHTNSNIG